ncbi:hypothetical protein ACIQWL_39240, partial [Streptomyces mirabilis]
MDQLERSFAEGAWDPAVMRVRLLEVGGGGWVDRGYAREVGWLLRERGLPAAVVYAAPDVEGLVVLTEEWPGFGAWLKERLEQMAPLTLEKLARVARVALKDVREIESGKAEPALYRRSLLEKALKNLKLAGQPLVTPPDLESTDKEAYGEWVKARRDWAGLPMEQLGLKVGGLNRHHIRMIEQGDKPDRNLHARLVKVLAPEPEPAGKKFGGWLKARREQARLTPEQLAPAANMNVYQLGSIESGEVELDPHGRGLLVGALQTLERPGQSGVGAASAGPSLRQPPGAPYAALVPEPMDGDPAGPAVPAAPGTGVHQWVSRQPNARVAQDDAIVLTGQGGLPSVVEGTHVPQPHTPAPVPAPAVPPAGAVTDAPAVPPGFGTFSSFAEEPVAQLDGGVGAGVPVVLGVLPGAGGAVHWLGEADEGVQRAAVEVLAAQGVGEEPSLVVALRPGEDRLSVLGGVPVSPGVVDQLERLFAEGVWDPASMPLRLLAVGGGGWVDRDYAWEVGWSLRERGLSAAGVYADPDVGGLAVLPSGGRPGAWLKEWRERLAPLTLKKLARVARVEPNDVREIESGKAEPALYRRSLLEEALKNLELAWRSLATPERLELADKKEYGEWVKARRDWAGLTKAELGRKVGLNKYYLRMTEQGEYKPENVTHGRLVEVLAPEPGPAGQKTFRGWLKARRKQARLTLEQLAPAANMNVYQLGSIESGDVELDPHGRGLLVGALQTLERAGQSGAGAAVSPASPDLPSSVVEGDEVPLSPADRTEDSGNSSTAGRVGGWNDALGGDDGEPMDEDSMDEAEGAGSDGGLPPLGLDELPDWDPEAAWKVAEGAGSDGGLPPLGLDELPDWDPEAAWKVAEGAGSDGGLPPLGLDELPDWDPKAAWEVAAVDLWGLNPVDGELDDGELGAVGQGGVSPDAAGGESAVYAPGTWIGGEPGWGRNFTGREVGDLDLSKWDVLQRDGTRRGAVDTPWGDGRVYVIVADGGPDGLLLPDGPGGRTRWYRPEEVVEVIAGDPERPPGIPVVILTGNAGGGLLALPRWSADRAGVTVWSMDAQYLFVTPEGGGRPHVAFLEALEGRQALGQWIASPPGMLPDPALDPSEGGMVFPGTDPSFTENDLVTYTMVDEKHQSTGRAAHNPEEFAENEWVYRSLPTVRHYVRYDPLTGTEGPLQEIPEGMRGAYLFAAHGRIFSNGVELPYKRRDPDGNEIVDKQSVPGQAIGQFIRRRPSFRGKHAVLLDACGLDAVHPEHHDPLIHDPAGQDVTEETGVPTFAYADEASFAKGGGRPPRIRIHGRLDEQREDIVLFVPKIADKWMKRVADRAGLGPKLPDRLERARRFTRALRNALPGIESPARADEYGTYLFGLGALDRMRWRLGEKSPLTGRRLDQLLSLFYGGHHLPVPADPGQALVGLLVQAGEHGWEMSLEEFMSSAVTAPRLTPAAPSGPSASSASGVGTSAWGATGQPGALGGPLRESHVKGGRGPVDQPQSRAGHEAPNRDASQAGPADDPAAAPHRPVITTSSTFPQDSAPPPVAETDTPPGPILRPGPERRAEVRQAPRVDAYAAAVAEESATLGWGMPRDNQLRFQAFADQRELVIDVRPTNVDSVKWLTLGALPKPVEIKAKTINALDVRLGALEENRGLVGFFEPRLPEGVSADDPVRGRYQQRLKEYRALQGQMDELSRAGRYQTVDGVVHAVTEAGTRRPLTGDHDIFRITRLDGSSVPVKEYEALIEEMKDSGMGVTHGALLEWDPQDAFGQEVYDTISAAHRLNDGGEPLLRFISHRRSSTVAYTDSDSVTMPDASRTGPTDEYLATLHADERTLDGTSGKGKARALDGALSRDPHSVPKTDIELAGEDWANVLSAYRKHTDPQGKPVGVSSRPAEDWQDGRQAPPADPAGAVTADAVPTASAPPLVALPQPASLSSAEPATAGWSGGLSGGASGTGSRRGGMVAGEPSGYAPSQQRALVAVHPDDDPARRAGMNFPDPFRNGLDEFHRKLKDADSKGKGKGRASSDADEIVGEYAAAFNRFLMNPSAEALQQGVEVRRAFLGKKPLFSSSERNEVRRVAAAQLEQLLVEQQRRLRADSSQRMVPGDTEDRIYGALLDPGHDALLDDDERAVRDSLRGPAQNWGGLHRAQAAALILVERRALQVAPREYNTARRRLSGVSWFAPYAAAGHSVEQVLDRTHDYLLETGILTTNMPFGDPGHPGSLIGVLTEGPHVTFKNYWESHSTGGQYSFALRGSREEHLGYSYVLNRTRGEFQKQSPDDNNDRFAPTDPSLLPKYAALISPNRPAGLLGYGDAAVHWKPSVRDRVSLTPVDSWENGIRGARGVTSSRNLYPLLAHGPEQVFRLAVAEATNFRFDPEMLQELQHGSLKHWDEYFEAQIHGPLGWGDVQKVVLSGPASWSQKAYLERFAEENGLYFPVEIAPADRSAGWSGGLSGAGAPGVAHGPLAEGMPIGGPLRAEQQRSGDVRSVSSAQPAPSGRPVDGGLPLEELQYVRAAVVQQLKVWKVNWPVDDATVARYHDRLPGVWKRRETTRARGERIALMMVSGRRLAEFPGIDAEPFAAGWPVGGPVEVEEPRQVGRGPGMVPLGEMRLDMVTLPGTDAFTGGPSAGSAHSDGGQVPQPPASQPVQQAGSSATPHYFFNPRSSRSGQDQG